MISFQIYRQLFSRTLMLQRMTHSRHISTLVNIPFSFIPILSSSFLLLRTQAHPLNYSITTDSRSNVWCIYRTSSLPIQSRFVLTLILSSNFTLLKAPTSLVNKFLYSLHPSSLGLLYAPPPPSQLSFG